MQIHPYVYSMLVSTGPHTHMSAITDEIQNLVDQSGVKDGLCIVVTNHSTAGLIINSKMDPATLCDLVDEIDRIVPTRIDFHHTYDTPRDAAAHVKAMLVGHSLSIPISKGELKLGSFSGIFFCEFDGPRERQVLIHVLGYE